MTFDADTTYKALQPRFQERIHRNESLARHSTFGAGGAADVWVTLESREELLGLVRLCAEEHWPLLVVGNSTNVLYADAGVRGIVARNALNTYSVEDRGNGTALLIADGGVGWARLLHELTPLGWGGLEFGVGIPGTLGGGVISNAGAHNDELGRVLELIEVLDARGSNAEENEFTVPLVRRYHHNELDLGYRYSRLREQHRTRFDEQGQILPAQRSMIEPPEIIMLLNIRLQREEPEALRAKISSYQQYRKMYEPPQRHTGTIFKDPPGNEAAHLIEQAGLQGNMSGKAQISTRNANYIVNVGGAQAADVAALIMETHRRVLEQFGVDLELDVELRGEWTAKAM